MCVVCRTILFDVSVRGQSSESGQRREEAEEWRNASVGAGLLRSAQPASVRRAEIYVCVIEAVAAVNAAAALRCGGTEEESPMSGTPYACSCFGLWRQLCVCDWTVRRSAWSQAIGNGVRVCLTDGGIVAWLDDWRKENDRK